MVKVTGGAGGRSRQGVLAHFNYIDRKGELEIETDEGRVRGKKVGAQLFNRWDLDLEEHRKREAHPHVHVVVKAVSEDDH